jgi:hypothetical protein
MTYLGECIVVYFAILLSEVTIWFFTYLQRPKRERADGRELAR